MRNFTKDVTMVFIALLLTGGIAHAMTPPPTNNPAKLVSAQTDPPPANEAPVAAVAAPEPVQPVETVPEPVAPAPAPQPVYTAPAPAPVVPANDGSAKSFIYMKESGNNPAAVNAGSGACGLGQALPCSKMPCSMSDYGCQDQFFTSYMLNRYGSWENARVFWINHQWW